jgi:hypothetical protein
MTRDCHASTNIPSFFTSFARFLKWAYDVTTASLRRAEDEVLDRDSGCKCKGARDFLFSQQKISRPSWYDCAVFFGCSSFLESNSGYPEKYENDGELVGLTKVSSSFCRLHLIKLSSTYHICVVTQLAHFERH